MFVTFVIVLFISGLILSGHLVFGHVHDHALDTIKHNEKKLTYMDNEVAAVSHLNKQLSQHLSLIRGDAPLTPFKRTKPREREQWWIDTWLDSWRRQVGSPYVALEGEPDYVEPAKTYIDATKVPVAKLREQYPTPKMTGYVEPLKPEVVFEPRHVALDRFYENMSGLVSEYDARQRRRDWEELNVRNRDFYAQQMVRPKLKAVSLYTGGYDADVTYEEENEELLRRIQALKSCINSY